MLGLQEDAVGRSPRENTGDLGPPGAEGLALLKEDQGPQEKDRDLQDQGKDRDLPFDLQEGPGQDHRKEGGANLEIIQEDLRKGQRIPSLSLLGDLNTERLTEMWLF